MARAQAALRLQTAMSSHRYTVPGGQGQVPRICIRLALLQLRAHKSSETAQRAVSEVGTKIGKLLSKTETHFVGPARNRESGSAQYGNVTCAYKNVFLMLAQSVQSN